MKQFIHSLWTLPMISSWRNIDSKLQTVLNLYTYTISAYYVKKFGGTINLYSDSLGLWLLEHAPYDDKFCDFEDINYLTLPCWAYPKIIAMEKTHTPFTHIDGDVFIKSQYMFDVITDDSVDLIVESQINNLKDESKFLSWHKNWFETYTDFSNDFDFSKTCNNGVLTFNNKALKDEFIEKYNNYRNQIFFTAKNVSAAWTHNVFVPDLIIEQMNLYQTSRKYQTRGIMNHLTGNQGDDSKKLYNDFYKQYTEEYRHYAGCEKGYMSIEYFRNMLKQLDQDLYRKTREKENELLRYLL